MINRWLKRWFKTCNYPKASQKIEAKSDKNEKWQWKSKCLLGKRALRLVPQPLNSQISNSLLCFLFSTLILLFWRINMKFHQTNI